MEPVFQLTVDQYHDLTRAGILTEEDPVELLEGILVFKMPKNAPHATCNGLLRREIERRLEPGWHYRSQEPLTLADGEPEPGGAVVRGGLEAYASSHPLPSDVALVIEIADTSLAQDRGIKLRSHGRAGLPIYWIINLSQRQVETYTEPDRSTEPPTYRTSMIYPVGSTVPFIVAGRVVGEIAVASILP